MNELAVILSNLTKQVAAAQTPLIVVAIAIGAAFLLIGLYGVAKGQARGEGGRGFICVVIGILLISFPSVLNMFSESLFGHEAELLSSVPNKGGNSIDVYVTFAVTLVVIVGIYCVIKGLIKLKQSGDGKADAFWSGMTHIFGGIICCNISSFAKIIGQSTQGVVQDLINKLF